MAAGLRRALYRQLEPRARDRPGLSPLNALLCALILLATGIAIVETEPLALQGRERLFHLLELGFGLVFAAEYLARLWVVPEQPGCAGPWRGRLRFMLSPAALIDLAVLLATFAPFILANPQLLRLLRLFRILRLAKLGRMSRAMRHLTNAVASRAAELWLTLALGAALVVFGASLLYWLEGSVQPDKFGSIPRALWWAVITLTTIGYGDVYPVTPAGKIVAAGVALCGIGLIAMPTGILAAAFSDAMQRSREEERGDLR